MAEKIVVLGSFIVDLTMRGPSLPRPGETVLCNSFAMGPGGKGSNQAVAAHRAGGDVTIITKLGRDMFADVARDFYRGERMDTGWVLCDETLPTGTALIGVSELSGQNQIAVYPGACNHFTREDIRKIQPVIENCGILLCQFETNLEALEAVLPPARQRGVRTILNPAPAREIPPALLDSVACITPNETEAESLTGVAVRDGESAARAAAAFHRRGVEQVVITLGGQGVFVSDGEQSRLLPAHPVPVLDTTGAGDAFNGAFATALAEGRDLFEAASFGNAAAALSVGTFGTAPSMPLRGAIDALLDGTGK